MGVLMGIAITLFIIISVFLILLILIQKGRGGGLASAFGGAGGNTAFGSKTKAIPVDGYGTFDGVMLDAFKRPRIEGKFAGEDIRAFDVTWGSVTGDAIIENSYADVKNVVVSSADGSAIQVDGKFSLGYPRRDGGEQINAHIRVIRRPVADLKLAFDIDDYVFSGTL